MRARSIIGRLSLTNGIDCHRDLVVFNVAIPNSINPVSHDSALVARELYVVIYIGIYVSVFVNVIRDNSTATYCPR